MRTEELQGLANDLREPLVSLGFHHADIARDLGRGAAFPATADVAGGLQTGDRFFRTDANWLMVYDGTEWITAHELECTITYSTDLTATYAATTNAIRRGLLRNAHQALLVRGEVSISLAAGTSNASNFWTVSIVAANLGTTVWSFTTDADTAGATALHTTTTFTQPASATDILRLDVAKTLGAPPNISIVGAVVFYRVILP